MADTDTMRRAVVAEALTWLRTPYHHAARIKVWANYLVNQLRARR